MPDREQSAGVHASVGAYEHVAAAYDQGRPGYPQAVLEQIVARSRVGPGSELLDLAAGTGKWTRQLLATGGHVHAVEPVEAFRKRLRELPVTVLAGTAEAIPLMDRSVDLVTVAAAFHWFDAPSALAEIARVLRPGGTLAILWNERDHQDPAQRALTDLIEPHRQGEPRQADEAWLAAFDTAAGFTVLEKEDFPHAHRFTAESLVERVRSISFIAALAARERDEVLTKARTLAANHPATFELPHVTHLYLTHRTGRRGFLGLSRRRAPLPLAGRREAPYPRTRFKKIPQEGPLERVLSQAACQTESRMAWINAMVAGGSGGSP